MTYRRPVALLLVAVVAGCGTSGGATSAPPPSAEGAPAASPLATAVRTPRPSPTLQPGVAQVIHFEEQVWGVVAAGDAIWVEGHFKLHQLDGSSGEELRTVDGS